MTSPASVVASDGPFLPVQPNTFYRRGQVALAGALTVQANATFVTGAAGYVAADWTTLTDGVPGASGGGGTVDQTARDSVTSLSASLPGAYARGKAVRREHAVRRYVTVMASPPTAVLSAADAATGISGSTLRAPKGLGVASAAVDMAGDPSFGYSGTPSAAAGTSINAPYLFTPILTGSTSSQRYSPSVLFNFYGNAFEIVFKALSTTWYYRLRVDGQFATEEAQYLTGLTTGSVYRVLVTFTSAAARQIQADLNGGGFAGIAAAPAHTVARVTEQADIPTVVLGDSITASANPGAAGSVRIDTWVTYCAHLLGWRNLYNVALASTGYATVGTEAAFITRTADYAVAGARVVIYGGLNDGAAYTGGTLTAALDTVMGAVQAAGPAEFIVFGWHPKNANDYVNATALAVNALLATKAAQYGATFIDPLATVKWVTGTGNSTTPNASGNADVFVNADNIHPTREGHKHFGRVMADAVAATYTRLAA